MRFPKNHSVFFPQMKATFVVVVVTILACFQCIHQYQNNVVGMNSAGMMKKPSSSSRSSSSSPSPPPQPASSLDDARKKKDGRTTDIMKKTRTIDRSVKEEDQIKILHQRQSSNKIVTASLTKKGRREGIEDRINRTDYHYSTIQQQQHSKPIKWTDAVHSSTDDDSLSSHVVSNILPLEVDMLRRRRRQIPFHTTLQYYNYTYNYTDQPYYHGPCSCLGAKNTNRWKNKDKDKDDEYDDEDRTLSISTNTDTTSRPTTTTTTTCCQRMIRRSHKMGVILMRSIVWDMKLFGTSASAATVKNRNKNKKKKTHDRKTKSNDDGVPNLHVELARGPYQYDYVKSFPKTDFRAVLIIRNIYQAFISGYLYHKSGAECNKHQIAAGRQDWYIGLSYIPPNVHNRTMCEYLANESEEIGLRAYLDYAMHLHYASLFRNWALAETFPILRERTLTVCYEHLTQQYETAVQAMNDMLYFFYNRTRDETETTTAERRNNGGEGEIKLPFQDEGNKLQRLMNYNGGHATSHDTSLRENLIQLIQKIDAEHYNGDIEWLNSVLPC